VGHVETDTNRSRGWLASYHQPSDRTPGDLSRRFGSNRFPWSVSSDYARVTQWWCMPRGAEMSESRKRREGITLQEIAEVISKEFGDAWKALAKRGGHLAGALAIVLSRRHSSLSFRKIGERRGRSNDAALPQTPNQTSHGSKTARTNGSPRRLSVSQNDSQCNMWRHDPICPVRTCFW